MQFADVDGPTLKPKRPTEDLISFYGPAFRMNKFRSLSTKICAASTKLTKTIRGEKKKKQKTKTTFSPISYTHTERFFFVRCRRNEPARYAVGPSVGAGFCFYLGIRPTPLAAVRLSPSFPRNNEFSLSLSLAVRTSLRVCVCVRFANQAFSKRGGPVIARDSLTLSLSLWHARTRPRQTN